MSQATNSLANRKTKLAALLCLLACSVSSFALTSDQYKPYYVSSSNWTFDSLKHISIYVGDVHAKQGTSHLDGTKVVAYLDKNNKNIVKLIAYGHPAHYSTLPDNSKSRLYAEADTIKYYPIDGHILLIKNGRVTQKENVFTGPHIWYDINKQIVKSSTNPGQKKTTIVITPDRK